MGGKMDIKRRKLSYKDPDLIEFSPENPRGLNQQQIRKSPRYKMLLNSIKAFGVLEPLIVKAKNKGSKKFVLVDGERRLRAAVDAEIKEVPIIIAKSSEDGRRLAYQVHMLRENWSKEAETKAIKGIMREIRVRKPDISDSDLRKELISITGHTDHDLQDILRLCNYRDETINKIINKELPKSYPIQIEQSFIAPIKRQYPEILDIIDENEMREILIEKALKNKLEDTRFLMDHFKVVFADNNNKIRIKKILLSFLNNEKQSIKTALDNYVKLSGKKSGSKKPKRKATVKSKAQKIAKGNMKFAYTKLKVTIKNQTKIEDIRKLLEKTKRKYTKEEEEYISEAIHCLDEHCFKAATLMIWASGISRILDFIQNDFNGFITASEDMKKNKKPFWRHFSENFNLKAQTIDDIKLQSNDRQLICYLYYKGIVQAAQGRQLLNAYNTRNDCAHPTDIKLNLNGVVSLFEYVHELILANENMQ